MPPLLTVDGLHDDLSRRHFLTAATAAGLLTACGSDTTSSPPTPAAQPWTFTDDRGVKVTLPVFGFVDGPVQDQVEQVAPIVAINAIEDLDNVIRRFEELAGVPGYGHPGAGGGHCATAPRGRPRGPTGRRRGEAWPARTRPLLQPL